MFRSPGIDPGIDYSRNVKTQTHRLEEYSKFQTSNSLTSEFHGTRNVNLQKNE